MSTGFRHVGPAAPKPPIAVENLEPRQLLSSGTLSVLAAFNGTNGAGPTAVVEDAGGNLFGVTNNSLIGSATQGPGEVFEIAAGSNAITVLATFSNADYAGGSLTIDSNGNLFGTENANNNANLPGLVFEVAKGTNTITTLATIPGFQGTLSELPGKGALMAVDGSDNIFGTDEFGNPFEVVHGSGTVTYLTQVGSGGEGPINASDLILAPNGSLFGTTFAGGANSAGSIFEIPAGTTNVQTLASFDSATTGSKPLGIALDSSGDLLGFCENGGPNSDGTAFELPSGSNTISLLASFSAATGDTPISKPVLGTSGDLYGLTENGGANGFGSLFDISTGQTPAAAPALVLDSLRGSPESVGASRSARPANASGSTINDLADLDNSEPLGEGNAGIAGGDPGDHTDDVRFEVQVFGRFFGETDPNSPGGLGAVDKFAPQSQPPPAPPAIKPLQDELNKLKNARRQQEDQLKKDKMLEKTDEGILNSIDSDIDKVQLKLDAERNLQMMLDQVVKMTNDLVNQLTTLQGKAVPQAVTDKSMAAVQAVRARSGTTKGNAAKIARLEKKIAAEEAVEASLLTKIDNNFNAITTLEATISALQAQIAASF